MKKRIFISDDITSAEDCKKLFLLVDDELEIGIASEVPIKKLPGDYDLYLLHLSTIDLEDLKRLRKEQPWSWIYGTFGGGKIPRTYNESLDGGYNRRHLVPNHIFDKLVKKLETHRREK